MAFLDSAWVPIYPQWYGRSCTILIGKIKQKKIVIKIVKTHFSPCTLDGCFLWMFTAKPSKTLFLSMKLGEILQTMSFAKSVPEGLKLSECEWGIGGKNSPIRYIPEKDPV